MRRRPGVDSSTPASAANTAGTGSRRFSDSGHPRVLRVRLIITTHFSSPCETARKHANACEHDPRLCAGDCLLEILGEATTAVEPGQGPFNHPAFGSALQVPILFVRVMISMVHGPSSAI